MLKQDYRHPRTSASAETGIQESRNTQTIDNTGFQVTTPLAPAGRPRGNDEEEWS